MCASSNSSTTQAPRKHQKCFECSNNAITFCADCRRPICKEHTHPIRRAVKCKDCSLHDRKVGIVKKYSLLAVMIIVLIVVLVLR